MLELFWYPNQTSKGEVLFLRVVWNYDVNFLRTVFTLEMQNIAKVIISNVNFDSSYSEIKN